jgi:biotin carboxylase
MEMNTRIQVEHPIEQVIDYDLIREQILVAAGVAISGRNYLPELHAIECRINAEDLTMTSDLHQEKLQHCICQVGMEFV